MPQIIYLDNNATTPLRGEARERMIALMQEPHNASSVHYYGREGKKYLENAREIIAQAVNCWKNEVVFMGSGSEANNTALHWARQEKCALFLSAIEHSSLIKAAPEASLLPVTGQGVIDVEKAVAMVASAEGMAFVAVMMANNETGVVQPVAELIRRLRGLEKRVVVHVDAAQALGKIPVDFSMLQADMMTLSAHKMGGPLGAAALIVRNDMPLHPLIRGGGQELGRRSGTENVPAISGFGVAVELAAKDAAHWKQVRGWLDEMEQVILAHAPTAIVVGKDALRLPGTSNIIMAGVSSETQLMAFDLLGIAISAGSACSSGRIEPSHVLRAMGFDVKAAGAAIRVSAGWNTTQADIQRFTKEWLNLYNRIGMKAA